MRIIERGRIYATDDGQVLQFHSARDAGMFTEDVIDILVDRLLAQQEILADGFTDRAVTQLLRARAQLTARTQVRTEAGITGKSQRTESVMPAVIQAEAEHARVAAREAAEKAK